MRARLAFAISMIIEFDCYLIDEITAVGDAKFYEKCEIELFERRRDRAMLIISHDLDYVRKHCQRFAVLAMEISYSILISTKPMKPICTIFTSVKAE
jgi:ABC-2 type transport system ATP-binding protein/capsular polysaccharide transport system ATP-binding protein